MQWGGVVMHLRLGRRADTATFVVEEDNQLLVPNEVHGYPVDTTRTEEALLMLSIDSLQMLCRMGPLGDCRAGGRWR